MKRIESLDGFRGVCALEVVAYHWNAHLNSNVFPLYGGFVSVDAFFVISGFVLALSYETKLRQGPGLRSFLRSRARRLLPVLFAAMPIVVLTTAVVARFDGRSFMAVMSRGAMETLLIPMQVNGEFWFSVNPVLWSLFDEWFVSIVFAVVLFRLRTRLLVLVFIFYAGWAAFLAANTPGGGGIVALPASLPRAMGGFTAGMLIFRLYAADWLRVPNVRPYIPFAVWAATCWIVSVWPDSFTEPAAAFVIAPLCVAVLARSTWPIGRLWRVLGALSYPLYASHYAVLVGMHELTLGGAFGLLLSLSLSLLLARTVQLVTERATHPSIVPNTAAT